MRMTSFERAVITWSSVTVASILVLIPLHATLTVWLAQYIGHYTALRLWKEYVLMLLVIVAAYIVLKRADIRKHVLASKLAWLIGAYLLVQVVWGLAALRLHQVAWFALGYGWIINTRFLLFFLVVWVLMLAGAGLYRYWPRIVFWPAAAVAVLGLLQYFVLPYDFMKYLGYGAATIFPYEDINHNVHYIRIMSSLRGANPLGAYMVVVLTLLGAWFVRQGTYWRSKPVFRCAAWVGLGIASAAALVLSFSRGAWLGVVVALVYLAVPLLWRSRTRLPLVLGAGAIVLVGILAVVVLRHNPIFQNVFLHTEDDSTIRTTSNAAHVSAVQGGLYQIVHEPLGRGPGTAGPASVYNTGHEGRIAENYYIQVAQETGWLGIALFIAINVYVGAELWRRRQDALALGLLAALLGIVVVNLLSHAWADDTLAYLWWGLAAIACSRSTVDRHPSAN